MYHKHLENHGWVVIPNVISRKTCKETTKAFEEYYKDMTGGSLEPDQFDRKDYDKFLPQHGILTHPEALSHAYFVQQIRNHPNVQNTFIELYNLKFPNFDLTESCYEDPSTSPTFHSYDRINYQPAPATLGKSTPNFTHPRYFWWHVDQSSSAPEFKCYQAYVDIAGSPTKLHAGLQVVDESHKMFRHLTYFYGGDDDKKWMKRDWRKFSLDELDEALPDWRENVVDVTSESGDMVIWDSRVLHMSRRNTASLQLNRSVGYDGGYWVLKDIDMTHRFVIYTCHWPNYAYWVDKPRKFAAQRGHIIKNKWSSSHWPDCRQRLTIGDPHGRPIDTTMQDRTISNWVLPPLEYPPDFPIQETEPIDDDLAPPNYEECMIDNTLIDLTNE